MNAANTTVDWTHRLAERPEIFPHQLNLVSDQVLLVKLSAAERKSASFLDQRVLTANTPGAWVPWQAVAGNLKPPAVPKLANYIFHVGHCGSTLLSRLLEFAPDTECLREPLLLRTLAQDIADSHDGRSFLTPQEHQLRLQKLSVLWTRGANHTIVKATSICTDLMPRVLSLQPAAKAIFIYHRPQAHLETLLAGQNHLIDLKSFAQIRVQRLRQMTNLDIRLDQLTLGQLTVLSWLSEVVRLESTQQEFATQIIQVNFDSFLQNPQDTLLALFRFLNIPVTAETALNAIASPVMRTYSKAPEHEYSAATRSALMADARRRFQFEIRDGLRWIEKLAQQSTLVSQAVQRFDS